MGIVELKGGTIIIRLKSHESKVVAERRPPTGTIESLLPLFEKAYASFPETLTPLPGYWEGLTQKAKYTPEEAIIKLRRHGFSVEEVTKETMRKMLTLSGVAGADEERAKNLENFLEEEIRNLYASTIGATGVKK